MSGRIRPSLLQQVIEELNIMDRQAHPALGKAKRDCIRALIEEHVEAANIVKCKDCKHYHKHQAKSDLMVCLVHLLTPHPMPKDGFCSYGEKRDAE